MNLRARFAIAHQTNGDYFQSLRDARAEQNTADLSNFKGQRLDGQLPDMPVARDTLGQKAGL